MEDDPTKEEMDKIHTPLLENQVLVFYNNIEVKDPSGGDDKTDEHYIDLEDPNYKLGFENSRHVGYVKLRSKDDRMKDRTLQTPNSHLSPTSASMTSEVESPESLFESENIVMKKFLESQSSLARKSFDESHPVNLPSLRQKPTEELRRNSSFKNQIIRENEDDIEEIPADFMNRLGERVSSNITNHPYHANPAIMTAPREVPRSPPPQQPPPPTKPSSASSLYVPASDRRRSRASSRGSLGSGSDFGYAVLKPRSLAPENDSGRHSIIPEDCFKSRQVLEEDDEEDFDEDEEGHGTEQRYLSSAQFMKHFESQFPGICRDIKKANLSGGSKSLPPNIICNEEPESNFEPGAVCKELRWFFMPTIEVPFNQFSASLEFFRFRLNK